MGRRRTIAVLVLAAAGAAATTSPAGATDGSLYTYGVNALVAQAVPDGQCSVQQTAASFGVTCPPMGTSLTGTKWQIDLRTPASGSVIESFIWRSVRFHQTATSIAQQVLADGATVWQVAEADIPRSPAQPKGYQVNLRATTTSLRLFQTEARQQPNRVWVFLDPTILVRDLEAPAGRWTAVPAGWGTDDRARVEWQTTDNFGSDGIGQQRIGLGGRLLYAASPGAGSQIADLDLAAVPDGVGTLRLEADGDGTAGSGLQDATLRIDRTPPTASVALLGLPDGLVRATVSVADATSGIREWRLKARGANGPTVASSATGGNIVDVDLAQHAVPGESIRFVLEATDNAGLTREVMSALATRPSAAIGAPTTIIGGDGPLGEPGRIEASGAPLPNFARIETRGLRVQQARAYNRSGRMLVPLVVATYSKQLRISGRFQHPNGRGLRGATVFLVDPRGFSRGTTLTDRRGRFTFRVRADRIGTWRAIALGRPLVVAPAFVQLRPLVRTRIAARTLRSGETLRITGTIAPRGAGRGKLVKLEWRLRGRWLPLQLATADRRGRFALRYRLAPGGAGFTVPMRVVVPREKGGRFLPIVARRFTLRVLP